MGLFDFFFEYYQILRFSSVEGILANWSIKKKKTFQICLDIWERNKSDANPDSQNVITWNKKYIDLHGLIFISFFLLELFSFALMLCWV